MNLCGWGSVEVFDMVLFGNARVPRRDQRLSLPAAPAPRSSPPRAAADAWTTPRSSP